MATRKRTAGGPPPEEQRLQVARAEARRSLDERIEIGQQMLDRPVNSAQGIDELKNDFRTWHDYNERLLQRLFTTTALADEYMPVMFMSGGSPDPQRRLQSVRYDIEHQKQKLVSIANRLDLYDEPSRVGSEAGRTSTMPRGQTVFVVHGHDDVRKLEVAHFIERVTGRRPTILHEQSNRGRTVIEKLEDHAAEAGFAVVLLTGDDVGGVDKVSLRPRARQNVVMELGLFMGLLGRSGVVALCEEGVERPSDIDGVLYLSFAEDWQLKLAQEMKAAKINLDLNKSLTP
ncbi:MAG: nucleotide-binding protein [Actinomycetota bacterium]|jgi:predicted nucleotide-binding protein|nr:nucleotide-binding protein [Actinomycetota bacterium]